MNADIESDVSEIPLEGIPTGSPPAPPPDTGDREFEFSLRLLTGVVIAALVASVSLLTYQWVMPRLASGAAVPVANTARRAVTPTQPADTAPARGDEVLMAPGKVFRCEEKGGGVSFSDQSCGNAQPERPPAK
jgi:hypothetical protein